MGSPTRVQATCITAPPACPLDPSAVWGASSPAQRPAGQAASPTCGVASQLEGRGIRSREQEAEEQECI